MASISAQHGSRRPKRSEKRSVPGGWHRVSSYPRSESLPPTPGCGWPPSGMRWRRWLVKALSRPGTVAGPLSAASLSSRPCGDRPRRVMTVPAPDVCRMSAGRCPPRRSGRSTPYCPALSPRPSGGSGSTATPPRPRSCRGPGSGPPPPRTQPTSQRSSRPPVHPARTCSRCTWPATGRHHQAGTIRSRHGGLSPAAASTAY